VYAAKQRLGRLRARLEQVLTVVEDHQHGGVGEVRDRGLQRGLAG
jgi:hypothetical protein